MFLALLMVLIFVLLPEPLRAELQDANLETFGAASGLATTSLPILVARIIRVFLSVIGLVFVVLVIYAGYLYLTAHGEPGPVETARKILKNAIIGLVIILSSFAITTFILNALLEASGLAGGVTTTAVNYTEPLSGSLGSGIIESHYPGRNASDIPRNTRIFITFKEPIDIDSIISGYDDAVAAGETTFDLNAGNVLIYQNDQVDEAAGIDPEDAALASEAVEVSFSDYEEEDGGPTIFVFDPVELLGSAASSMNYTVKFEPEILKADGSDAFSGSYSDGYEWTFEVSTEIDLTPPYVISVVPSTGGEEDRNVVVSLTFSEAMDPVASTGAYGNGETFSNIEVLSGESGSQSNVEGVFSISNVYQTVEFVPADVCGEDPCGDAIYCLPGSSDIEVQAHAATLSDDPPQASASGGLFDGLVDAAGNSLDGDGDWEETGGEAGDDYSWSFETTAEVNDDVPVISALTPGVKEDEVDVNADVEITFNLPMQSSTVNSSNIILTPDHDQSLWYSLSRDDSDAGTANDSSDDFSTATIDHATLWESVENTDGSVTYYLYYPVVTNDVKSAWQICMFPSDGPDESGSASTTCGDDDYPYCCNGSASDEPCQTINIDTTLGQ